MPGTWGKLSTAHAATPATVIQTNLLPPAPATATPTVTAYEPTVMISIRRSIQADQMKTVQVPEAMAAGLVQNAGDFTGKTTIATLLVADNIRVLAGDSVIGTLQRGVSPETLAGEPPRP